MAIKDWFKTNKSITEVENIDKRQAPSARVLNKITRRQVIRQNEDISKWREATRDAESEFNPDRTSLIRIYRDISIDSHLSSLMQTLKMKVVGANWFITDMDGNISEEQTKKFQKRWFRETLGHIVDQKFFGHSLIQFGPIKDDGFTSVKLVPREFVIPEKDMVKHEIFNTQSGSDYTSLPYRRWVMEVGEPGDFGLLHKAAPWALWKKNVVAVWSEFTEIFGMPLRIAKTDTRDPEQSKNLESFLKNMGSAAYAIIDNDDQIEIVQRSDQDTHKVFNEFVGRANSEMSKLILGQTMTSDDGASRSQAEIHERVMNDIVTAYKVHVEDQANWRLLPLMVEHGMIPDGFLLKADHEEKASLKDEFDWVDKLTKSGAYIVPPEFIEKRFNIPVEIKDTPEPEPFGGPEPGEQLELVDNKLNSVMADVQDMYNELIRSHKH